MTDMSLLHATAGPDTANATLFVGIDIGSSGVRAVAIDDAGVQRGQAGVPMAVALADGAARRQDPALWWNAVQQALSALLLQVPAHRVRAIAVDGTSGTVLVSDAKGNALSSGWMYNDASCATEAAQVARHAPPESAAHGASSPLARMLRLQREVPGGTHLLHQADWIAGQFGNRFGWSDSNNALKLGYDPVREQWPAWMDALAVRRDWLPRVRRPGTPMARIAPALAQRFGLPTEVQIVAGTTDGVAAFLATGAREVGDAVTSLGTTLVVKVLSATPVFAPQFGIYSHRLGELWLPGGASNSGGAALLAHFDVARMTALTPALRPEQPTGLDYYPLPAPGERFPINDPALCSRVTPRPPDDVQFFQGLLEGVSGIEQLAYQRIADLGAPYPQRVFTVGGGAGNTAWTRIREQRLGATMALPPHDDAAYGTALLARDGAWQVAAPEPVGGAQP